MARDGRVTYPTMDAQRSDTFKAFDVTTLRGEEKRKRREGVRFRIRRETKEPIRWRAATRGLGASIFFFLDLTHLLPAGIGTRPAVAGMLKYSLQVLNTVWGWGRSGGRDALTGAWKTRATHAALTPSGILLSLFRPEGTRWGVRSFSWHFEQIACDGRTRTGGHRTKF